MWLSVAAGFIFAREGRHQLKRTSPPPKKENKQMTQFFDPKQKTALLAIFLLIFTAPVTGAAVAATASQQTAGHLSSLQPKTHDAALAMSAETVLVKSKRGELLHLVDVRSPEEFKRLRIRGAINVPLHFVKTKRFLKDAPVVLINEGYHTSPLEQECATLRDLGFTVFILDGGICGGAMKGYGLQGDQLALDDLRRVSPRQFSQEKDYANSLILDISAVPVEGARELIPAAIHMADLADNHQSMLKLRQTVEQRRGERFFNVLVVSAAGENYEEVQKHLALAGINAFYLEGGLSAYQSYAQNLALSWMPREKRVKSVGACRPCGEKVSE
jgi:rhodanese-related sulfurtransferase